MKTTLEISTLRNDIHTALKLWHDTDSEAAPLNYLHLYRQARLDDTVGVRQATNRLLLDALDRLTVDNETDATLLRKRFLDGMVMHAVANWLNAGESTAYRKQQEALTRLATVVQSHELEAREQYQANLEKRLHLPPEVPLVGGQAHLDALLAVLTSPEAAWLLSIEGLGGIGKTALANALVRRPELTNHFGEVAWVSAKLQHLSPGLGLTETPQATITADGLTDDLLIQLGQTAAQTRPPREKRLILTRLLKAAPHLIVIDNLETVLDIEALLPFLNEVANPTKFVLTSRRSMQGHSEVFCLPLGGLDQADTFRLIRQEANLRGLTLLAKAEDAELNGIYEVVGGNPLALKLVVGQIAVLPLSQVLDNLKEARGKNIDELYSYIYWQAWQVLEPAARQAFLVMPLAQDGTLAQLEAISQLEMAELGQALQQLALLSLVQVGGTLEERRYEIHRLTETFLLKEAIRWQQSA